MRVVRGRATALKYVLLSAGSSKDEVSGVGFAHLAASSKADQVGSG